MASTSNPICLGDEAGGLHEPRSLGLTWATQLDMITKDNKSLKQTRKTKDVLLQQL